MKGGGPVVWVQSVVVVGHGGGHGCGLSLGGARAEMGDQAHAQGICGVQALHRAQVPGHLRQALSEADAHEVHGKSVGVEVAWKRGWATWG